jgi:hypothetical protein
MGSFGHVPPDLVSTASGETGMSELHYLSQTGRSFSELDLAREHLRKRQAALARERVALNKHRAMRNSPQVMLECVKDVLAALSWVWDAQERAERGAVEWLNTEMRKGILELLSNVEPIRFDEAGRQSVADLISSYTITVIDGRAA